MVIGVDADGVLTDMAGFNQKYGELFWNKKPVNPAAYKTGDMFGMSHGQEILFGIRYFYVYCVKLPPRENAAEAINGLISRGHGLYVITARKYSVTKTPLGALSRGLFKKWLDINGLRFSDIFFCSETGTPARKLEHCRKISADMMIDDNPDIALHLADNGISVLLFDAPYNRGAEHENIIRVHSWNEIAEVIDNKEKGRS